jgi:thiosulfate dehydrogenase [quinone] large subunit
MRKGSISAAMALFPLRLFLGGTFVYAGVQKLSDPGFLHAGAPTYIGTQLHGFAAGTPGGFILNTFAAPHPELAGIGVAVTEILIGLLVTAGLFTRVAAAGGLALNFLLFLTASWHTSPYFLGPDLIFSFAWLPFVLVGAEGQPAFDNLSENPSPAISRRTQLRPADGAPPDPTSTRRVLLAEFAGVAVAIAGISTLAKGTYTTARRLGAGTGGSAGAGSRGGGSGSANAPRPASSSPSGSGGAATSVPSGAVKLGPGSRLPSGQAATYSDPADGSPDILIRDSEGNLKAFSAVCTHAGCTVDYESGTIVCPCHGGEYSAETGEVIAGPPPSPLAPKKVLESGGQIYAVPS